MANVKALLIEALNTLDFSADILPFLQTKIPAPPSLPADTDEADLLVGQLSQYLTNIIASFEGFTPIDLLLHAGQKNATLQGILLSGLELAKAAKPHDIKPIIPVSDQTFAVEENIKFSANVEGIDECTGVYVIITGPANTNLKLVPVGGFLYEATEGIGFQEAGSYVATFQGWFGEYVVEKVVNFEVS